MSSSKMSNKRLEQSLSLFSELQLSSWLTKILVGLQETREHQDGLQDCRLTYLERVEMLDVSIIDPAIILAANTTSLDHFQSSLTSFTRTSDSNANLGSTDIQ